jgi:hypothetical protein
MSNKLIADLMSFRARMVSDARTQVMFEGDFDTIDQAIATLRKSPIAAPQQAIPSGWKLVPIQLPYDALRSVIVNHFERATKGECFLFDDFWKALLSASPTAPIESDK